MRRWNTERRLKEKKGGEAINDKRKGVDGLKMTPKQMDKYRLKESKSSMTERGESQM